MSEATTDREFALGCPSTHCNRREECASPNDCIRTEKQRDDSDRESERRAEQRAEDCYGGFEGQ